MRPSETHPVDVDLIRGLEVIQHALDQLEGLEAGSTNPQTQEGLAVAAASMAEIGSQLAGCVVASFRGINFDTEDDSDDGFEGRALDVGPRGLR